MNLIENKKAGFGYELGEKYEAGIKLYGGEVKSLRNHRGSLSGAYVAIRGSEAFLIGCEIPSYQPKNVATVGAKNYDPKRVRKLLLSKKEIKKLSERETQKGLTLIPLSMYNIGRNIKISFAIGRGKSGKDKRETIKRREADREILRTLKKRR